MSEKIIFFLMVVPFFVFVVFCAVLDPETSISSIDNMDTFVTEKYFNVFIANKIQSVEVICTKPIVHPFVGSDSRIYLTRQKYSGIKHFSAEEKDVYNICSQLPLKNSNIQSQFRLLIERSKEDNALLLKQNISEAKLRQLLTKNGYLNFIEQLVKTSEKITNEQLLQEATLEKERKAEIENQVRRNQEWTSFFESNKKQSETKNRGGIVKQ